MIDTAEERRSVAGLSVGWGITPEAAKDAAWRMQVAWDYSGLLSEVPVAVLGCVHGGDFTLSVVRLGDRIVTALTTQDYALTTVSVNDESC